MRLRAFWAAAAVAVIIASTFAAQAQACRYSWNNWYFPSGTGPGAYYGCAATYQACAPSYAASGPICAVTTCRRGLCGTFYRAYNACGCCWSGGCGYGCGYGCFSRCGWGYGKGWGCLALTRCHYRHAYKHACRAKYRGYCGYGFGGYGCGWGCGDYCCADSGGFGCADGASGCESDGDGHMIYEPTPAPEAVEGTTAEASAMTERPGPFRLAAWQARQGTGAFTRGVASYRNGSMNNALSEFEQAAEAEPSNAMYQYHRALALFEISGADAAQDALQQAVELESRDPVKDWGKRMERVQGRGRVWIERARREAGLVH